MRDVLRIETERLALRAIEYSDCARIAVFLSDFGVSRMVGSVPHPYPPTAAEGWLMTMRARAPLGEDFVYAIDLDGEGLIGVMGAHKRASTEGTRNIVGYWIGRPYWGEGFASEALKGFVSEAERLGVLYGDHFVDNPASGRVLEKAGFEPTGVTEPGFSMARGEKATVRALKRTPGVRVSADAAALCAC